MGLQALCGRQSKESGVRMSITDEQFAKWMDERAEKGKRNAWSGPGLETEKLMEIMRSNLPEVVPPLPYDMTDEGIRLAQFKKCCPEEFYQKPNRALLPHPEAFDLVAGWSGESPGPVAYGRTATGKTRAAWSALGRLHVKESKNFAWFPVKRLITEFNRYESKDMADEFWRYYKNFRVLMVDDLDKINWQFDSESAALFQFYDWIYREGRPCITTTNKGPEWWTEKMGEAFTRRLFKDAHYAVEFA